jgi:multicomponent Na+:H+ antiporter subunit E
VTRRWPVAGVLLAGVWLFVRGIARTGDVTLADFGITLVEEAVVGLGIGLPLAYYTRNLYGDEVFVTKGLRSLPYAVLYLGLFVWELVTANLDVAYRVLAPSMPIEPEVYEVPLRVESDLAVTTIANSITLTPGTLTMDYDPDRNALYVHALASRGRKDVVEPIRRWEDYALVIFHERRSPGDPVPRRPRQEYEVENPRTPTVESEGPTETDATTRRDRGGEGS